MGIRQAAAKSGHTLVGAAVGQALEGPVLSRAATFTGALLLAISPPGFSLSLGEVNVRSAIGQRLVASVPVRIGEGENLAEGCASAHNGPSGLGNLRQAEVATPKAGKPGVYTLELTTRTALHEPMYELELRVDCPGAPAVVRQYVLMLDLPGSRYAADLAAASLPSTPAVSSASAAYSPPPTTSAFRREPGPDGPALPSGVAYRVREGDSLSSIAARVEGRRESLWTLADRIFAANPDAFIRGNPNLIRLGAEILIPGGTAVAPAAQAAAAPALAAPAPKEPPAPPAPMPVAVTAPAAVGSTPSTTDSAEPPATAAGAAASTAAALPTARPAISKAPRIDAAPADPDAAAAVAPSPLAATIAGVVFGLVVSGLLWLGRNLPTRKPWRNSSRRDATASPAPVSDAPRAAPAPIPVAAHRPLPSFTVSYSQPEDDPLAGEFPAVNSPTSATKTGSAEITSELEQIFGSTGTGADDGKTIAARAFDTALAADNPGSEAPGVDILLGEDHDTARAPALAAGDEMPDPLSNSGTIDLHALAGSGSPDRAQARDLMDALTLLERDYEEELTASQVLDLSAMRRALDASEDDDEATTLRQKSG